MFKHYFLPLVLITAVPALAQEIPAPEALLPVLTLRINPLGFVNKARAQAEVTLGAVGLGVVSSYYYAGSFTGPKAEIYGRFYTGRRLAEGFYLQAKGGVGRYTTNPRFDISSSSYDSRGFLTNVSTELDQPDGERNFVAGGGGGGLGYQFRLGHGRRFVLDVYAGLQYVPLPREINGFTRTTATPGGGRTTAEYDNSDGFVEWYGLGPGAVLNSMVGIGYTFGGKGLGDAPRSRRYRVVPSAPAAPEPLTRKAALAQPQPWARQ